MADVSGTKLTRADRDAFIRALSAGHTVTAAAKIINRGRRTMYELRERDEAFAADWDAAIEVGIDALEQEAYRRAFEGTEKRVYYMGEVAGVEKQFSDTLLLQLLRTRAPSRWGNRLKLAAEVTIDHAAEILEARRRAGLPVELPAPTEGVIEDANDWDT